MNVNVHVQQLRQVGINIGKMERKHSIACKVPVTQKNVKLTKHSKLATFLDAKLNNISLCYIIELLRVT